MAVTFGNAGTGSSASFSFTNNGNLLSVGVSSTANTVTGVTFNGVAATQVSTTQSNATTGRFLSLWNLANPAAGANTVAITGGANHDVVVISIIGTQAGTPYNAVATNSGTSTTPSLAITTTIDQAYAVGWQFSGNTSSAGANTTVVGSPSYTTFWRSTSSVSPAGSQTLNTTITSTEWNFIGFAANPTLTNTRRNITNLPLLGV